MRESSLESLLLLATLFVVHEKHAKALALLEGLRELAPRDERVLRLLCHSLVMEKRYERALELIQELPFAAKGGPQNLDLACALRLKASALWGLGRNQEARAALEQSIAAVSGGAADEEPPAAKRFSLFR